MQRLFELNMELTLATLMMTPESGTPILKTCFPKNHLRIIQNYLKSKRRLFQEHEVRKERAQYQLVALSGIS